VNFAHRGAEMTVKVAPINNFILDLDEKAFVRPASFYSH
jgi:hypothetical protein